MAKGRLREGLMGLSKEQVVEIVLDLYGASEEAKAWFEFRLEPDSSAELERYKKAIQGQFYRRNGAPKNPSFKECNALIATFKKLVPDLYAIADLMLYYVEQGCSLTAEFGDYEVPFYTALDNNFHKAIKFIYENGLREEFRPRMKKMIKSVECCGYGFQDTLWDMYYQYAGG